MIGGGNLAAEKRCWLRGFVGGKEEVGVGGRPSRIARVHGATLHVGRYARSVREVPRVAAPPATGEIEQVGLCMLSQG